MMSTEPLKEKDCLAVTFERKYYHCGRTFIKRSLRPREFRTGWRGLHIPRMGKERLMNEAESLDFIRANTNIPVPVVHCQFEDDEAYYLITEYVEGESMADLNDAQKAIVAEELGRHLATLKTLKSNKMGGPGGLVIPPYRVQLQTEHDHWVLEQASSDEYVFCHNDLSQQNVVVDAGTLKIQAIIDWEYAGFYPSYFEFPFYNRLGPSSAINDEKDDSPELLRYLQSKEKGQNPTERPDENENINTCNKKTSTSQIQ